MPPFAPRVFYSHSSVQLQEKVGESDNSGIEARGNDDSGIPTFTTEEKTNDKRPKKRKVAAIVGGAVAAGMKHSLETITSFSRLLWFFIFPFEGMHKSNQA